MAKITVHIQYFGAFRDLGDGVSVTVDAPATIAKIKQSLLKSIDPQHGTLVANSVLASDDTILQDGDCIDDAITLSILPPVCGG